MRHKLQKFKMVFLLLAAPAVSMADGCPAAAGYEIVIGAPAQAATDQGMILQKCLDLANLQAYYPKNVDGSFKQLQVLQHAVSFPVNIGVQHAGQPVAFISKDDINSGMVDAFFYFHEFRVEQNTARIDYAFNYDQLSGAPKMQMITLELQKTANGWNVVQTKMEAR